jgi:hypothetical protein
MTGRPLTPAELEVVGDLIGIALAIIVIVWLLAGASSSDGDDGA